MKRLLREPLVQFLLVGATLFGVFRFVGPGRDAEPTSRTIQLTMDDLSQLGVTFRSQWRREPTPQELQGLVESRIREEILYREALAMGLDKEDAIVKRRMAQKMQFLSDDVAAAKEPSTDDLVRWFEDHPDAFAQPKRLSFRHLYFSPDLRGERARDDAAAALAKLVGLREDAKLAAALAGRFMLQEYYRDRAPEFLAREFGPDFAAAVDKLPVGSWQGPVESGFGWHLIFVDAAIPGGLPTFDEAVAEVRTAWLEAQKSKAWEQAYQEMRAKYTVLIPAPP